MLYLRNVSIEQTRELLDGSGDFRVTLSIDIDTHAANPTEALMRALAGLGLIVEEKAEA